MKSRTFTIIKPNAVCSGNTGKILDMIISAGFTLRAMKMTYLSRNAAEKFYAVHKGKPFFEELIEFMTSGPVIAAIIEGEDAVKTFRELVGSTNPDNAAEGTIRKLFAEGLTRNAIHASDSDINAAAEWQHFFCDAEIIDVDY